MLRKMTNWNNLEREILTNQFKNEKIRFSERNLKSVLDKFELKKIDELS